jgi:hypothetical protein
VKITTDEVVAMTIALLFVDALLLGSLSFLAIVHFGVALLAVRYTPALVCRIRTRRHRSANQQSLQSLDLERNIEGTSVEAHGRSSTLIAVASLLVLLAPPVAAVLIWALEVYVFNKSFYPNCFVRVQSLMAFLPVAIVLGFAAREVVRAIGS